MRFRPANISLINRRHYLPRLLLTLSSKYENENHPTDLQLLTGSHHINFRLAHHPISILEGDVGRLTFAPHIGTCNPLQSSIDDHSCQSSE